MDDCSDCIALLNETTDVPTRDSYPNCSRAELDAAGYEPTICPDPNYPIDENGYYKDPYPRRQAAPVAAECEPPRYERRVQVTHLQPRPLEPSGLLTIIERRPRQPSPPPRKQIWCPPRSPPKPSPIILRTRPPTPPPPFPSRICEVTVPHLPRPPPSVEKHMCVYPTPPPDIIVEQWLPYGRRPPREVKVIRAHCPHPREPLHNVCIIHDAPEARIEHIIQGPEIIPGDPNTYMQEYGSTLLDTESLREELFGLLRNTHANEDFLRRVATVVMEPDIVHY